MYSTNANIKKKKKVCAYICEVVARLVLLPGYRQQLYQNRVQQRLVHRVELVDAKLQGLEDELLDTLRDPPMERHCCGRLNRSARRYRAMIAAVVSREKLLFVQYQVYHNRYRVRRTSYPGSKSDKWWDARHSPIVYDTTVLWHAVEITTT